jgi:hypothetical protein
MILLPTPTAEFYTDMTPGAYAITCEILSKRK